MTFQLCSIAVIFFTFLILYVVKASIIPPTEGLCPPKKIWINQCPPGQHFYCIDIQGYFNRSVQRCFLYHIPKGTYLKETVVNGKIRAWPATCPDDTFNPDEEWSNTSTLKTGCRSKTKCEEEGEYVYSNGTETTDRRCRCMFWEGWTSYSNLETFTNNDPLPDCYPVHCSAGTELKNGSDSRCLPCDDYSFKKNAGYGNCKRKKRCKYGIKFYGNTTHDKTCKDDVFTATVLSLIFQNSGNSVVTTATPQLMFSSTQDYQQVEQEDNDSVSIVIITFSTILVTVILVPLICYTTDFNNFRQRFIQCCRCNRKKRKEEKMKKRKKPDQVVHVQVTTNKTNIFNLHDAKLKDVNIGCGTGVIVKHEEDPDDTGEAEELLLDNKGTGHGSNATMCTDKTSQSKQSVSAPLAELEDLDNYND